MIRPVEPDAPEPLRRVDPRVPRTESKPDHLGEQRVQKHDEQSRGPGERPPRHELAGDRVTLHRDEREVEPGDPSSGKPVADVPVTTKPSGHVDLEG